MSSQLFTSDGGKSIEPLEKRFLRNEKGKSDKANQCYENLFNVSPRHDHIPPINRLHCCSSMPQTLFFHAPKPIISAISGGKKSRKR